jgi:drug/metabolite transporter (DMT)-like permease
MSIPPGVRYMAGSALFFSLMSLFVKLSGERLPTMQIVLARYVVMLVATTWMVRRAGISVRGTDRRSLIGRSVTGFLALTLFYFAITRLPLGDVTTIHFVSPVFTALIAALALKERTGSKVAIGMGFSLFGVLLVAQPSFLFGGQGLDQTAVGAGLIAALLSATAYVFVRKLRATDHPYVVIFWFSAIGLVLSLPIAAPSLIMPTPREWLLLLGVGLTTQVAQVFLTRGLHLEAAGKATSIGYLQIIFAFTWGALVFGDMPGLLNLTGAAIIAGSVIAVSGRKK